MSARDAAALLQPTPDEPSGPKSMEPAATRLIPPWNREKLVIVFFANIYLGYRLAGKSGVGWAVLAVFFLLQLVTAFLPSFDQAFLSRRRLGGLVPAIHWLSYLALGLFSVVFLLLCAADGLRALFWLASPAWLAPFLGKYEAIGVVGLTVASGIAGVFQAFAGPSVRRVEVPLARLPGELDGFRIAQVSDLHISSTLGREYVARVVELVNSLDADLVAMTGDFVDGKVAHLGSALEPLGKIRSACGGFFVPGNHEYYFGADEWIAEHRKMGVKVLLNAHEIVRKGGASLAIAGIPDPMAAKLAPGQGPDARVAAAGIPADIPRVLLAHRPSSLDAAAKAGFDLQLSGHTHAGQFFPCNLLVKLGHRYYKGLNRHRGMWLYVNQGTGYWGPPLRTAVPAEITLLTLRASRGS